MHTKENAHGLVSVQGDDALAGAVVMWSLSGPLDIDALRSAWEREGLDPDDLLSEPSIDVALRRAVRECENAEHRAEHLDDERGWALVENAAIGVDDQSVVERVACTARLVEHGDAWFLEVKGNGVLAAKIRTDYARFLSLLLPQDVSAWLITRAYRQVNAVMLRDHGGVYFVPRPTLDTWRAMTQAVKAASRHKFTLIPAMRSEDCVAAVLDAVRAEAEQEVVRLSEVLDENAGKQHGSRALRSRAEAALSTDAKLASYEGLLGVKLDEVRASVAALHAKLAAATLAAEAAEEDARAAR